MKYFIWLYSHLLCLFFFFFPPKNASFDPLLNWFHNPLISLDPPFIKPSLGPPECLKFVQWLRKGRETGLSHSYNVRSSCHFQPIPHALLPSVTPIRVENLVFSHTDESACQIRSCGCGCRRYLKPNGQTNKTPFYYEAFQMCTEVETGPMAASVPPSPRFDFLPHSLHPILLLNSSLRSFFFFSFAEEFQSKSQTSWHFTHKYLSVRFFLRNYNAVTMPDRNSSNFLKIIFSPC